MGRYVFNGSIVESQRITGHPDSCSYTHSQTHKCMNTCVIRKQINRSTGKTATGDIMVSGGDNKVGTHYSQRSWGCAQSRHSVFTVAMHTVVKIFSWALVWPFKCLFSPRMQCQVREAPNLEGLRRCMIMCIQAFICPDPPLPIDSICRPCPWEWTFFHRKCYYFSKCQRNWNDSVAACQEVDAQLVTVESDEEKVCCLVGFFILGPDMMIECERNGWKESVSG